MSVVTFPVAPRAPKSEPTTYVGLAESNKLLRKQLAKAFPGVKFRVRGESYSGGSSTRIDWVDGPTRAQVEKISCAYSNRGFDGSIDLAYGKTSWQPPDGSIVLGWSEGTEGSMGSTPGYANPKPHPAARAVCTGIGYVFTNREISEPFAAACMAAALAAAETAKQRSNAAVQQREERRKLRRPPQDFDTSPLPLFGDSSRQLELF